MDFYNMCTADKKEGGMALFPNFIVGRSEDLMVRGGKFYAVWDEEAGLWSTDEYDVQRLVDLEMRSYGEELDRSSGIVHDVRYLRNFANNGWTTFRKFINNVSDNSVQLDRSLTFANTEVSKKDYASRRLGYSLIPGDFSAWDEIVGTLYPAEEREKLEWAIGAIVSGDAKKIQKFMVLYGPAGTGKSTILGIIEKLFQGYVATFDAKALGSTNGTFATEVFKNNPLVAIQHDGDLSRIEDNTRLNSIAAHENMTMNEKYKASYTSAVDAFLFMGTNKPVKITDAKSGIIRRLIDVHPSGARIPANRYNTLMSKIDFELGAIAHHCLEVYLSLGKNHYSTYRPLEMMLQTDIFFNFIEANFDIFKSQDGTSLKQAYSLYKEYCGETGIEKVLPQYKVREELRNYFDDFKDRHTVGGEVIRSYYLGFNANKFKAPVKEGPAFSLVLEETESLLDDVLAEMPAQYGKEVPEMGIIPEKYWTDAERMINGKLRKPRADQVVGTTLGDLDTSNLHYVKVPDRHLVIDFDLMDSSGAKSLELNLEAASVWPPTYAELSQGGNGVHLHYYYDGDQSELSGSYSEGIEVKTLLGDSSLRRRLTKCNNVPIAVLNKRLPLKEKKVLTSNTIQSEKGLRDLIDRNLKKEIHSGTKPSIDFIYKILEDAHNSGMVFDVTDLRSKIVVFANNSTHQPMNCLKLVQRMKFKSEVSVEELDVTPDEVGTVGRDEIVLYDVEVYPNLFVVCWKYRGDTTVVRMVNPKPAEIEQLMRLRLMGFYNRRYDNHILWGAFLGYNNQELYELSQSLITKNQGGFREAYGISYGDIYDFSTKKQSLKRFEVDLGILHMEMDLPWDEPVAEEDIPRVVEYCVNDVNATDEVLTDRWDDWQARLILAELSGLSPNSTTQQHTAKIIFGSDRNPHASFKYTNLSEEFDGYKFELARSSYRGEDPGEGGYVYAEPGIHENVALLDVASMHPTTMGVLNIFGDEYTKRFLDLKEARMAIKRKDYATARAVLDGKLEPFVGDGERDLSGLAYALKIAINIVYGLTSAKFDNPFKDPRNIDNIVAKRGALFMIDLKHAVQEQGFTVAHIKTDSIKIPNATPEIIQFVTDFGARYGYDFEHEATYDKMFLANDAVYIAREGDKWTATGAQFQHPYVYKTLFTHEEVTFDDLCETKQVQKGHIYLDFEHDRPAVLSSDGMHFVGKIGRFVPVTQESGGGLLYRVVEDKLYAVQGTKGYLWMEAERARSMGDKITIDTDYFEALGDEAVAAINKFGNYEEFIK